jgi:deazaflavin-dependent oxidoreductase (nitroreductase family)
VTRQYRVGFGTRVINRVFSALTRLGFGARYRRVLTVAGRQSGVPRSTPVDVMFVDGSQWLVAPYGEVNWVRNVRAATEVTLRRGRTERRWRAVEVHGMDAVPAIRAYIRSVRVTRPYWEVGADAPDVEVAALTERHPVFRLVPLDDR